MYEEKLLVRSKAEVYRAAMRLIEQHGAAAEMAAVRRGDPVTQTDEKARQAILDAIADLRAAQQTKLN